MERLAIEDYFFKKEVNVTLSPTMTAVVVPYDQTANVTSEDFAVLIEFALAVLTVSGFEPVILVAILKGNTLFSIHCLCGIPLIN
jgi:hypothetical protein